MTELKEIISKNLRKYRKEAKLSQTALARQLGISPSSVSNWEQGLNSIDIDTLFKVCKILNVPISSMVDQDDPKIDYVVPLSDSKKELIQYVKTMDEKEVQLHLALMSHFIKIYEQMRKKSEELK